MEKYLNGVRTFMCCALCIITFIVLLRVRPEKCVRLCVCLSLRWCSAPLLFRFIFFSFFFLIFLFVSSFLRLLRARAFASWIFLNSIFFYYFSVFSYFIANQICFGFILHYSRHRNVAVWSFAQRTTYFICLYCCLSTDKKIYVSWSFPCRMTKSAESLI